ncbi:MAG: ZIP family metal transporter [Candidatus Aminicenantia bacterium]
MSILFYIIISTFLISLIAFAGALTLFLKEKLLDKILLILVAFSAGILIGGAFLHLIPEAIERVTPDEVLNLFLYLILGFCTFFVLENFIGWHHHHKREHLAIKPFSYLLLISDSIHNFIDGLIIAASFVISFPVGVVTALAVALHEIPQEIGDFGILIYGGFKKEKALVLNFLSAITVIFGGIVGFFLSEEIGKSIVFLLPFAAGNFIYIASSDLIPEIKHQASLKKLIINFFVFLLGIVLMLLIKLL